MARVGDEVCIVSSPLLVYVVEFRILPKCQYTSVNVVPDLPRWYQPKSRYTRLADVAVLVGLKAATWIVWNMRMDWSVVGTCRLKGKSCRQFQVWGRSSTSIPDNVLAACKLRQGSGKEQLPGRITVPRRVTGLWAITHTKTGQIARPKRGYFSPDLPVDFGLHLDDQPITARICSTLAKFA